MINRRLAIGLAAILVSSAISFAAEDTITLRAGSELDVEMITTLSSKANESGDMWTGKVIQPVFGKGGEIVPDGSTVDGHITFVSPPGQAKPKSKEKEKGDFLLIADSISMPDSTKYDIVANAQAAGGAQPQGQGTGGITALASTFSTKKGKNVVIGPGTEVTFAISHDITAKKVPVRQ
jgi:hypothetical protein